MVAVSFTKYRIGEEMADKTTGNRTGGKKSSSETLKKSACPKTAGKLQKGERGAAELQKCMPKTESVQVPARVSLFRKEGQQGRMKSPDAEYRLSVRHR